MQGRSHGDSRRAIARRAAKPTFLLAYPTFPKSYNHYLISFLPRKFNEVNIVLMLGVLIEMLHYSIVALFH
jgi:hypothetical protein